MGLRGVVTCSNPHDAGTPDLSDPIWNPFWQTCVDLSLSINFHIGSSESVMGWFGRTPWPSFDLEQKLSIASSNLFLGKAQIIGNLIYGGVPERFPDAKFVSVESGIGWIPFFLEALDHQIGETAPSLASKLSLTPTEYFHRQFFACFWFERIAIDRLLDVIGVNNVMFETDFPHPTCLYPKSNEKIRATMAKLDHATRKRIVQDNAAELYRIPFESRRGKNEQRGTQVRDSRAMVATIVPRRLHHHAFVVADQERTRRFYEDVLGMPLVATWCEREHIRGKEREYCHTFFALADERFSPGRSSGTCSCSRRSRSRSRTFSSRSQPAQN